MEGEGEGRRGRGKGWGREVMGGCALCKVIKQKREFSDTNLEIRKPCQRFD